MKIPKIIVNKIKMLPVDFEDKYGKFLRIEGLKRDSKREEFLEVWGGGRTDKALNELREAEANSIEDSNVLTKLITQDFKKKIFVSEEFGWAEAGNWEFCDFFNWPSLTSSFKPQFGILFITKRKRNNFGKIRAKSQLFSYCENGLLIFKVNILTP